MAEEKTLYVSPLNQLQLDMVTKFYQYVQLTKTTALTDADVMNLTEDDYVVFLLRWDQQVLAVHT